MANVTKTIGATGRAYATIVLWDADLDDASEYNADDDAVGVCYDDADFDMNGDITLDGGDLDDGSGDLNIKTLIQMIMIDQLKIALMSIRIDQK